MLSCGERVRGGGGSSSMSLSFLPVHRGRGPIPKPSLPARRLQGLPKPAVLRAVPGPRPCASCRRAPPLHVPKPRVPSTRPLPSPTPPPTASRRTPPHTRGSPPLRLLLGPHRLCSSLDCTLAWTWPPAPTNLMSRRRPQRVWPRRQPQCRGQSGLRLHAASVLLCKDTAPKTPRLSPSLVNALPPPPPAPPSTC